MQFRVSSGKTIVTPTKTELNQMQATIDTCAAIAQCADDASAKKAGEALQVVLKKYSPVAKSSETNTDTAGSSA